MIFMTLSTKSASAVTIAISKMIVIATTATSSAVMMTAATAATSSRLNAPLAVQR